MKSACEFEADGRKNEGNEHAACWWFCQIQKRLQKMLRENRSPVEWSDAVVDRIECSFGCTSKVLGNSMFLDSLEGIANGTASTPYFIQLSIIKGFIWFSSSTIIIIRSIQQSTAAVAGSCRCENENMIKSIDLCNHRPIVPDTHTAHFLWKFPLLLVLLLLLLLWTLIVSAVRGGRLWLLPSLSMCWSSCTLI